MKQAVRNCANCRRPINEPSKRNTVGGGCTEYSVWRVEQVAAFDIGQTRYDPGRERELRARQLPVPLSCGTFGHTNFAGAVESQAATGSELRLIPAVFDRFLPNCSNLSWRENGARVRPVTAETPENQVTRQVGYTPYTVSRGEDQRRNQKFSMTSETTNQEGKSRRDRERERERKRR